jgi:hypothetical protein
MKKLKTYGLSAAVLGGLFLVGSLLHSRDSQAKGATYSTPVTVMNTTSQPALGADVEKLARVPFQSEATGAVCLIDTCTYDFNKLVPAGSRLVIENLSGHFQTPSSSPVTGVSGDLVTGGTHGVLHFSAPLGDSLFSSRHAAFSMLARGYIDASDGPIFASVSAFWNTGSLTLTGYLENCSITGCPAIQR